MRTLLLSLSRLSAAFVHADEWTPPENPDPSAIIQEAAADCRAGKYEIALAKQDSGDPFYTAKLHTARFYFARLLPETAGLIRTARSGLQPLMAMDEALF